MNRLVIVCVCGYRAVQTLDLNLQNLLLFEQVLELGLSRVQDLGVLGLHHLDVVKLEKEKQDGEIKRRKKEENNISKEKRTLLWYHSSVSFRFFLASLSYWLRILLSISARLEFWESISTFTSESLIFSRRASTSCKSHS